MTRIKGNKKIVANFEVELGQPLDARVVVPVKLDLQGLLYAYKGLIVVVTDDPFLDNNGGYLCTEPYDLFNPTTTPVFVKVIDESGANLDDYVLKVPGKDLSSNDYTTTEKNKLASINNQYRGTYTSLLSLKITIPIAEPGDNAIVDDGVSRVEYVWDHTSGDWLLGTSTPITTDQSIIEGSINPVAGGAVHGALADKVDKAAGKSLVSDTEIAKIHAPGSDDQDLSNLVVKEFGKGLSANDYIDADKTKLSLLSEHYRGTFASAVLLEEAAIEGNPGDYVIIDAGIGSDSIQYIWDISDSKWLTTQSVGGGGHTIKDSDETLTQRAGLKFTGNVAVTDDSGGDNTVVEILGQNITVDAVPTDGSNNPVASGGVFDALAGKLNTGITTDSIDDTTTRRYTSDAEKATWNAIIGGAVFQSTWNALTNSPLLISSNGTKGHYYIVNVAGTTTLDTINDWKIGDWAIFDGVLWRKVDNTDSVSSVNNLTGAILLDTSNVPETVNKRYQTDNQQTFNDATSSIQTQIDNKTNHKSVISSVAWDGTSYAIPLSIETLIKRTINNSVTTLTLSLEFPVDAATISRLVSIIIDNSGNSSAISSIIFTGGNWRWDVGVQPTGLAAGAVATLEIYNESATDVKPNWTVRA